MTFHIYWHLTLFTVLYDEYIFLSGRKSEVYFLSSSAIRLTLRQIMSIASEIYKSFEWYYSSLYTKMSKYERLKLEYMYLARVYEINFNEMNVEWNKFLCMYLYSVKMVIHFWNLFTHEFLSLKLKLFWGQNVRQLQSDIQFRSLGSKMNCCLQLMNRLLKKQSSWTLSSCCLTTATLKFLTNKKERKQNKNIKHVFIQYLEGNMKNLMEQQCSIMSSFLLCFFFFFLKKPLTDKCDDNGKKHD